VAAVSAIAAQQVSTPFEEQVAALFRAQHQRLFRLLHRMSGDPDLAADIAQEAFVRMYSRGSLPGSPEGWLVTVALNLFRNERTTGARRRQLMTPHRAAGVLGDAPPTPAQSLDAAETENRVRQALHNLPERDSALLLMRAEGYSYREMAAVLGFNESSLGTLLARARRAFLEQYKGE
jgi:RNA polymerase sigma-70 factor (ECF subfamily)